MWYIQSKTIFSATEYQKAVGELEISKNDYYRVLSISKDKNSKLLLKWELNSSFVNNYFDVGFKAW